MKIDLHRFYTAIKERRGELAYDLNRAEARVADIKQQITETETAITNIESEVKNAKGTIE